MSPSRTALPDKVVTSEVSARVPVALGTVIVWSALGLVIARVVWFSSAVAPSNTKALAP